jgi:flagellar hook protein FlgE
MGLYSTLNTSVSGMAAQANKLGTIGDNIANSSTTGYKRASTEFETLLGDSGSSNYSSGGVLTSVGYGISTQGTITSTTSNTDLAINGNGFFVGQDSSGAQALTRAGSFQKQTDGTLQNTAGYTLMGYALPGGSTLVPINVGSTGLVAQASSSATLSVNLNSQSTNVAAADLPSANAATASYSFMQQVTAYDNLGTPITLDVYMSKKDDSGNWDVAVYNHAQAASSTANFPYNNPSADPQPMNASTLAFDPTTGSYASGSPISVPIPNGGTVKIDMSKSTQLAAKSATTTATIDGSSPASLSSISIGKDGTVSQVYSNGVSKASFQVALANVASPDLLTPISGDSYTTNSASGSMIVSVPGTGGMGDIDSSSLESSTVDLATELTDMISAQRGYEANSKVLQTASDLLGTLNNIRVS